MPIIAVSLELYEGAQAGTGGVKLRQWFDESAGTFGELVRGKRVMIVDEVDDTRATLQYAVAELVRRNAPAAVGVCVVHNKKKDKTGILPESVVYIAGENVEDKWLCYPWDARAYGRGIAEHEALATAQRHGGDVHVSPGTACAPAAAATAATAATAASLAAAALLGALLALLISRPRAA